MLLLPLLWLFVGQQHQAPPVRFTAEDFNPAVLEKILKYKVDSLRFVRDRYRLAHSEPLYKAAKDHAVYLARIQSVSHDQKDPGSKSAEDRVKKHGGFYYSLGENIAQIKVLHETVTVLPDKKKRVEVISTYQAAGNALIFAWMNSPGHYAQILDPKYTHTGIAVALDPRSLTVTAVEVFSQMQ